MRSIILSIVVTFSQVMPLTAQPLPRSQSQQTTLAPANATLSWHTFVGGFSIFETASALAADKSGNVYVAGLSNATWGMPVRGFTHDDDAFIAKLDPNGKSHLEHIPGRRPKRSRRRDSG